MAFKPGKTAAVRALGKDWRFGPLDVEIIEKFRDWVADLLGDPFAELERWADKLSPEAAAAEFREAKAVKKQLSCFSLACPLATEYLNSELGKIELNFLLLEKNHPGVTRDQVMAIAQEVGEREMEEKRKEAHGEVPGGNGAAPADVPEKSPA